MKSIIGIVAVAGAAAAASALPANIDRSGYTIYAPAAQQAIDSIAPNEFVGVAYSNMTSSSEGFFSVSNTTPVADGNLDVVNFDDYQSIAPNGGFLDSFRFVGGVNTAQTDPLLPPNPGGVVFFDFFDAGGNLVDGFGVNLSQGGNFIWTINITNNDVAVASGGFVQMSFDDEGLFGAAVSRAQWFVTADDATVGDNLVGAFPGGSPLGADLNQAFELTLVPAPGAVAMLGLGGLAATRRRR